MLEASRLVVVDEWNGKYVINEVYRSPAEKLCKMFDELKHIPVPAILFVDNTEGTGKDRDRYIAAKISKVPDKWQDLIKQMTDRCFCYMIEFFRKNMEDMSWPQVVMLLYHELRHIGTNGELIAHHIEEWNEVAYNLGADWTGKNRIIPNLLESGGSWDFMRQPRLFEDESGIRRIK